MNANRWQKIEEGVAAAAEMRDGKRAAWLDEFCAGDEDLKSEIKSLLAYENKSGGFLETSLALLAAKILPDEENNFDGKQFGHYRIIREIGAGGMGAVFLAERSDGEFNQEVAVKIVRQAIAERELLERFGRERQILANLNHPNIAKLLDGGVSETGEPFLVMEYVEGEDNPETPKTMVSVGDLLMQKGEHAEADKFYNQRLSILRREQKTGAIDADYLFSALHDYALLKRAQGDSKTAETLLREALDLRPQLSAELKGTVSIADSILALTLADQGNFDEAEKIACAKSAEVRANLSSETPEFAGSLTFLGSILSEKGEYDEAENDLSQAETIYRKLFRQTFLALGDNLRLQAQTLYFQDKLPEATAKIDECLEIYRNGTSAQYVNYPGALTIQGLILNKQGKQIEAEKILREAVRIRAENLPDGNFMRSLADGALGECLTAQKRFAEAEPILLESYESLKNSQGENNPRTRLAARRLVSLYRDWNKPEPAASYADDLRGAR